MTSLSKRRKAKHRAKSTGASDRFYLGTKLKDYKYGMFNSSVRMSNKKQVETKTGD